MTSQRATSPQTTRHGIDSDCIPAALAADHEGRVRQRFVIEVFFEEHGLCLLKQVDLLSQNNYLPFAVSKRSSMHLSMYFRCGSTTW
jgi:hypothetical protein